MGKADPGTACVDYDENGCIDTSNESAHKGAAMRSA